MNGNPLAVGGDPEARHGIVLTADYIAKKYGVSDAYYVLRRLKASSAYVYDSSKDTFSKSMDTPFLELDELCVKINTREIKMETQQSSMYTSNEKQYDSYIQELIKEKFMEYTRFIQTDAYERIWSINKTALQESGFRLELY